jgi:hypothetical protein
MDVIPFISTKSQMDIPFFLQYLFPRSFCDELLHEIREKNCVHFPYSEKTLNALFFEVAYIMFAEAQILYSISTARNGCPLNSSALFNNPYTLIVTKKIFGSPIWTS